MSKFDKKIIQIDVATYFGKQGYDIKFKWNDEKVLYIVYKWAPLSCSFL
jgi:hypothetical protein